MTSVTKPLGKISRLGFLAGQMQVPDDFDRMAREEIEQLLAGSIREDAPVDPQPPLATDD
jgi:hypothetical protein